MDIHLTDTYFTLDHIHILPLFIVLVVIVIPFWAIFRKAGFSGSLSLLMFIPLVNIILLYFLAISRWKVTSSPPPASLPR